MKSILIFIVCFSLFASCSNFRHKKPEQTLIISFGSGGGFTGVMNEFILKDNGVLSKIEAIKTDTTTIKTLKSKETSDCFKILAEDSMKNLELNESGNMTYFITLFKEKKIVKSYHWTDGSDIPIDLQLLYGRLMAHTKSLK